MAAPQVPSDHSIRVRDEVGILDEGPFASDCTHGAVFRWQILGTGGERDGRGGRVSLADPTVSVFSAWSKRGIGCKMFHGCPR